MTDSFVSFLKAVTYDFTVMAVLAIMVDSIFIALDIFNERKRNR